MINDRKIGTWKNPVSGLADQPTQSASALKAVFDSNSNELKEALNGVIDDLKGTSGAENIGYGDTTLKGAIENLSSGISDTYTKEETDEKLSTKIDKVPDKGLSSNDYTDEEKTKLEGLPNEVYSKTDINAKLAKKVNTEEGKGLSSNDFTNEEKTKLEGLPNEVYSKTDINAKLAKKVNTEEGKGLSSNDFTNEEKTKLAGLIQNLPEIAVSEMDNAEAGIYRVARNRTEINDAENNSYIELSGGYGILIVENYAYYYQGIPNEDGMYQTLYDADGKVMTRFKSSVNDWESWSEYVPSRNITHQSYISSVYGNTTTYTFSPKTSTSPSAAYKINHTNTETVEFEFGSPENSSYTNEILIYFKSSLDSAIVWGSGVGFVNDEVPEILADTYYRIVAEYNPLMSKWVIGVICDGTGV